MAEVIGSTQKHDKKDRFKTRKVVAGAALVLTTAMAAAGCGSSNSSKLISAQGKAKAPATKPATGPLSPLAQEFTKVVHRNLCTPSIKSMVYNYLKLTSSDSFCTPVDATKKTDRIDTTFIDSAADATFHGVTNGVNVFEFENSPTREFEPSGFGVQPQTTYVNGEPAYWIANQDILILQPSKNQELEVSVVDSQSTSTLREKFAVMLATTVEHYAMK
jgi:hypothetical protein